MTAPLTEAERRFHASLPHPGEERPWRITDLNSFECLVCGFKPGRRYEHAAEASDAAVVHARQEHSEARHG